MNTRRYSRTMQEAFGPYTSRELHPMPDRTGDRCPWWLAAVVLCGALGFIATYWRA